MRLLICLVFLNLFAVSFGQTEQLKLDNHIEQFHVKKTSSLDSALIHLEESKDLSIKLRDSVKLAQVIDYFGWVYARKGLHIQAIGFFNRALEISKNVGDDLRKAIILNHIMLSYQEIGILDSALYYGHESLNSRILLKDTVRIIRALNHLGVAYSKLNYDEEAIRIQTEAIRINTLFSEDINITQSYRNLLSYYSKNNRYEVLDSLIPIVISACEPNCTEYDRIIGKYYRGFKLYRNEDYQLALSLFNEVELELADQNHGPYLAANHKFKALTFKKLGNKEMFLRNMEAGLLEAKRNYLLVEQKNLYKIYFEYFESTNDFSNALVYRQLYESIVDSLINSQTMWNVSKIQSDLVQAKSQEIIEQKEATIAEKEKVNSLLQLVGALSILLVTGTLFAYRTIRKKNRVIQDQNHDLSQYNYELKNDIDVKDQELDYTRKSVDTMISRVSHDVRGKVATLKLLTALAKNDDPEVQEYLNKISSTAKDADETIAGLTALSRIRSRDAQLSRTKLPPRLLTRFSPAIDEFEILTDNVLFFSIEELLTEIGESLTLELVRKRLKLSVNVSIDIEGWEPYLNGKDDFHPNVEFELMELKVAADKLGGKVHIREHQDQVKLWVDLPL